MTKEEKREARIQEGRRLYRDGEFKRAIRKRHADDILWDAVILECGHEGQMLARDEDQTTNCDQCIKAFIERSK